MLRHIDSEIRGTMRFQHKDGEIERISEMESLQHAWYNTTTVFYAREA